MLFEIAHRTHFHYSQPVFLEPMTVMLRPRSDASQTVRSHRIVITPEFHHWHHANEVDAHNSNYSVFLPLWDIVFGTFRNPKEFAAETGFHDGASAKIPQMLMFQDVAGGEFDAAAQAATR